MIAIRRWMFRGWGLEAGLRVHVIQPSSRASAEKAPDLMLAERVAADRARARQADRMRSEAQIRWITLGG